eukprot:8109510-Pyramimonas_sp.AAC.1
MEQSLWCGHAISGTVRPTAARGRRQGQTQCPRRLCGRARGTQTTAGQALQSGFEILPPRLGCTIPPRERRNTSRAEM